MSSTSSMLANPVQAGYLSSPGLVQPVLIGGLISGTLDALDGVVFNGIANNLSPIQVLQYIASGFFGAGSFDMGLTSAAVGAISHYFIAFVLALIYVGAARFVPALNRYWLGFGLAFGSAVFVVMNFIVLPQTKVVPTQITLAFMVNGLVGHALFVGLPIGWASARSRRDR